MRRRPNLDTLVQIAAAHGQMAGGAPLKAVQARTQLPVAALVPGVAGRKLGKALTWTAAEDDYLRQHLGLLSEEEMARHLGRTVVGVHLRWKRDLELPAPSKCPDCLTTQKIAETLGVDPKAAVRWVDLGLMRGRRLPLGRVVRSVRRTDFQAWVLNPRNWIFFQPARVRDPKLRRLLQLKAKLWGDHWLTVGQAARLRGVCIAVVNNALHDGRLNGVKWGNWHLLHSEVMKPGLRFYAGKGGRGVPKVDWSERADAFLVLAAAVGLTAEVTAQMMGGQRSRLAWTGKRVAYRLRVLKREGCIARLIKQYGLKVRYCRGRLSAEWRDYQRRLKPLQNKPEISECSTISIRNTLCQL